MESTSVTARPLTVRSAVTNHPLFLRGVDGRTTAARRYRDLAISLADELGGEARLDEPTKILIRQSAALTVQVETLQTQIIGGQDVDVEQLTRLSNSLERTLRRLGIKRRGAEAIRRRTLQEVRAAKAAAEAAQP